MANVNAGLQGIFAAEDLQKHLFAYAKIDTIMCANDIWLKCYHYDKHWVPGGHFFKIDDNGGDHYYILCTPKGCIVKGFDHECELSPYNFDEDETIIHYDFYHGAPQNLIALLEDPALEKDLVTFCLWQSTGESKWHVALLDIPDDWNDGIDTFSFYTHGINEYKTWFEEDYYESELDAEVFDKIFNGQEITPEMIQTLNPQADVDVVLKCLADFA